jgi:tetratricopeptide (TPR) repeat protein
MVPFLALSAMSLAGGPYGDVGRHLTALIVWLAVLILVGLLRWPRRQPGRDAVWLGGAVALFAGLAALSMLWTESIERSYLEFTRGTLYLGLFVLAIVVVGQRGNTRAIVDGLSLGAAFTLAMAALSRLEPGLFPQSEIARAFPETAARLSYPFEYWNAVAALAAIAVPLILFQASRSDVSLRRRSIAAGFLPVLGLVVYMTSSRGGLLAAAAATTVYLALARDRWAVLRPLAVGGAGAVAAILVLRSADALNRGLTETSAARDQGHRVLLVLVVLAIGCALVARVAERLPSPVAVRVSPGRALALAGVVTVVTVAALAVAVGVEKSVDEPARGPGNTQARVASTSANGRTDYWESSVDAFADAPLGGHGAGTWEFWWRRNATLDAPVRDAHSLIADTGATLGIVGLVSLLAVLGGVLWAGARRWRSERSELWAALLGGALAFEISAAVDWTWKFPAIAGLFFVLAGLMVARGPGPEPVPNERRRRLPGSGLRTAIVVLAWVALCTQATPLLASWQLDRSRDAARSGDLDKARDAAESARSIEPWSASADLQLAQVLEAQGDVDRAREYALDAVDSEPTNWRNWFVLARIEAARPGSDRALEYLTKARSLNPRSKVWADLGFTTQQRGLSRTLLDPEFTADDQLSSFRGGRRVFGDSVDGNESREIRAGDVVEAPAVEGLEPGRRYRVTLFVKTTRRSPQPRHGRLGDTSGSGWPIKAWSIPADQRWHRVSATLEATRPTERLAILYYSKGPAVRVDAVRIEPVRRP